MSPWESSERIPLLDPTSTSEPAISEMEEGERRRAYSHRSLLQGLKAELAALPESVNPFKYNLFSDKGVAKFHQTKNDVRNLQVAYEALQRTVRYTTTGRRSPANTDEDMRFTHDMMRKFKSARDELGSRALVDSGVAKSISILDRYRSEAELARLEYFLTEAQQTGDAHTCLEKAEMFTQVGWDGKCDSKCFYHEALTFT